jgi:hypothetical protein
MKILCLVCELWLVELFIKGGEVSYWCERCHQDAMSEHERNAANAKQSSPMMDPRLPEGSMKTPCLQVAVNDFAG